MITTLILSLLFQADAARLFHDDRGYAFTLSQTEEVVRLSREAASAFPPVETPQGPWVAAVCPHDDHALAGPIYFPAMRNARAPRLILLGVAHQAWKRNCGNVLIFDGHAEWNGHDGRIAVDSLLRGKLLKALAPTDVLVNNGFHAEEHSLEALIPWIQRLDCGSKIVPILVSPMSWEHMEALAADLAGAMAAVATKRNWEMGRDFQILISNDATHYGDQGWGGKNHAPYGTGCEGLAKATANDRRLIDAYLEGPIRPQRLKGLLYELVDEKDLTTYKVTWCGRFAIPFGLEFTRRLAQKMGMPAPEGKLLAYSTSVELGQLEIEDLPPTAPSNLRHWVGYAAMGWWPPQPPEGQ